MSLSSEKNKYQCITIQTFRYQCNTKNLLLQPHSRQYEMHLFANMNVVTVSVNRTSSEKIPHTGDTESLQRVDSSTNTKTEKKLRDRIFFISGVQHFLGGGSNFFLLFFYLLGSIFSSLGVAGAI